MNLIGFGARPVDDFDKRGARKGKAGDFFLLLFLLPAFVSVFFMD